jgi:hypothetical protein
MRLLRLYYGPDRNGGPWIDPEDMVAEDPAVRRSRSDGDLITCLSDEDPEAFVVHLRVLAWSAKVQEADRG